MTYVSKPQESLKEQTALKQNMIMESQTYKQMALVLLSGMSSLKCEPGMKPIDLAATLCARDYKGLNNFGCNGVLECKKNYIGTLYTGVSDAFQAGICPIARCLKAEKYDLAAVEIIKSTERIDMKMAQMQSISKQSKAECRLGNLNGATGGNYAGQVYDKDYLCPTLTDMQGGGRQPHIVEVEKLDIEQQIVAMRGRNPENPSDRTAGIPTEQRLEPNKDGICNTLTSVQKDNLVLELTNKIDDKYHRFIYEIDGYLYLIRIRKLVPKCCWRLMGFTDEDFHRAESVNSNTQLYKQAGNSIVKNVLVAIMGQLFEDKEDVYKNI